MKRVKEFSIISIILLIFQLFSGAFGLLVAAAPEDQVSSTDELVLIEVLDHDASHITWSVAMSEALEITDAIDLEITFDDGQSHESIDTPEKTKVSKQSSGYQLEIPMDQKDEQLNLTTKITNSEQEQFTLNVDIQIDGKSFKTNHSIKNEFNIEEEKENEREENSTEKTSDSEQEANETIHEEKEQKSTDESNKAKEEKKDQNLDDIDTSELDPVDGISHPPFATTKKPNALAEVNRNSFQNEQQSLVLNKQAARTNRFAEWEVSLSVKGKELKTTSDIVLVFDKSNSKNKQSRLQKAKVATKKFVETVLNNGSGARIALVEFSDHANLAKDFTTHDDKGSLISKINNIRTSGGTNIQAGLHQAELMLQASNADQKTIILLSDGAPNRSFKAKEATSYTWPKDIYNYKLANFNYRQQLGDGRNYELSKRQCILGLCFGQQYTVDNYSVKTNGVATISEAQNIISRGIDIYSVGLAVGGDQKAKFVLENSHNKGYFSSSSDDIDHILDDIASHLVYAATEAMVKDPLGKMFNLVKDGSYNGENFEVTKGSVTWNDETKSFSWDIDKIKEDQVYELKYKVALNCKKHPKLGEQYKTNRKTTINYTDEKNENHTQKFPTPKVSIDEGKVTHLGYAVNSDKKPIDADGNVVSNIADAKKLYEKDLPGKFQANKLYKIPAGETPEGYQLFVGENPTKVTIADVCTVVPFGYVKTSALQAGDITVKHVDESGEQIAPTEIIQGTIDESYETKRATIDGYEFLNMHKDSAEPSGIFTAEEQTVIYVYKQQTGTIKLVKVDENNPDKKLAGAKFAVKNSDGKVVAEFETDHQGLALSNELPIGDYTLEEIEAPKGYQLSHNEHLSITVQANKETSLTVTNKQLTGSVKVIKVDAKDQNIYLKGAKFELVDESNNIFTQSTNDEGELIFNNLQIGQYTLKETKAPDGYQLLQQPIEIDITEDQLHITKTIENNQLGWELPKTGGNGTLWYYGLGLMLMGIALLFVTRRTYI